MKLNIVAPLHPNEYYVLDGGFSTQLSRFEVQSLRGGEEFSKHRAHCSYFQICQGSRH